MAMLIGYARISTDGQDDALQLDALQRAGVEKVFSDTASGSLASRPQLDVMLAQLRAGEPNPLLLESLCELEGVAN